MERSLRKLFTETKELTRRYGRCLLQNSYVKEKEWEDLSSFMIYVCDENTSQELTFDRLKKFVGEVFSDDAEAEDIDAEALPFQFASEVRLYLSKMELGKESKTYKDFEVAVLNKRHRKKPENDVTALQENLNRVDPLTKLPLTDPVQNSVCGHVYEKSTIIQLLNMKENVKCPIPGCVAAPKIMQKDLVPYTLPEPNLEEEQ